MLKPTSHKTTPPEGVKLVGDGGMIKPSPSPSILSAQNLSLYYPTSAKPVLHNINVTIHAGEFILITGPSGSGKSSLIHCLSGLIPRSIQGEMNGTVCLSGKNIQEIPSWEISRSLDVVFQEPEDQFFTMKVEDELAFGPENHGLPAEEIFSRIHQTALHTGIKPLLHQSLHSLSDGQKQRVAIAANLTMEPQILLFDEPTSNLDHHATQQFYTFLEKLHQQQKRTIIVIEHRLHIAASIANRMIIMQEGHILYDGEPHQFHNQKCPAQWGLRQKEAPSSLDHNFWQNSNGNNPTKALLSLSHLQFHFHRKKKFTLSIPSFHAEAGEAIAIGGDNGAGKTTLLRLLSGALVPHSGNILLQGKKAHRLSVHQRSRIVRLVLQNTDHQLFMPNVLSELTYISRLRSKKEKKEVEKKAAMLLQHFYLHHLLDRHPHSLSIGEKQRLAIAAAIIHDPLILLLDEPTSGMDGDNINRLINLLKKLKDEGMILIIASHDIELIGAVCERGIKLPFSRFSSISP